jgi:hypothetical protein
MWKTADRATRRELFDPVQIRQAMDKRDGDTQLRRAEQYRKLSELAHPISWGKLKLGSVTYQRDCRTTLA